MSSAKKPQLAFCVGVFCVIAGAAFYHFQVTQQPYWWYQSSHPIGYADTTAEVHVHSDLVVFLDGARLDLTAEKYQSVTGRVLHQHVHLHDQNQDVVHRHAPDVSFKEFFSSLGMELTNTALTLDTGERYENTADKQLRLFVNGRERSDIISYVNQEADQVLLYYGLYDTDLIAAELSRITDVSCIYSGTCPQRGIAPPENCGLTCEL